MPGSRGGAKEGTVCGYVWLCVCDALGVAETLKGERADLGCFSTGSLFVCTLGRGLERSLVPPDPCRARGTGGGSSSLVLCHQRGGEV